MIGHKSIDFYRSNMKNIRCYYCNKFGHIAKECKNKSMDRHNQYGKKPNKNIDNREFEKDRSTKKKEKKDHIRCGLTVFSFEDEDDSGCSHHMTGDNSKMESLMKNHHGNGILGTNV